MKKIIKTDNAPKPIGPYNQAVIAGNYLYISGQIALKPKSGDLIAGSNVYIGFKYISTGSNSATYEIDNVLVTGE